MVLFCLSILNAGAEELRIAVSSNFAATLKDIVRVYKKQSDKAHIVLSVASTGKLYAQIVNAANYHMFFAADVKRPRLLEQSGRAVAGSRFTYAVGRLVLWSPNLPLRQGDSLINGDFVYLSIANPRLAPYGAAAKAYLKSQGLWKKLQGRIVSGENINQALQFVVSGNAQLGLLAYSQIKRLGVGSYWLVPGADYPPIRQQAVILVETPASRDFAAFMQSTPVMKLMEDNGYHAKL